MPRRNVRTSARQVPKAGRTRTAGFWHALAAGITPADIATIEANR